MFPSVRFRLEVFEECGSTQELLLGRRGSPGFHGLAVLALRQTAGYGRRGREWSSGEGNLALSIGLEVPEAVLPLLTFACGLALFVVVARMLPPGADLRLKWPNDLYLGGRKLAGMLAQGRQVPGKGAEVVVGIGVNLAHAPAGLPVPAVALASYCPVPSPEGFARELLDELARVFASVETFEQLRTEWEQAARLGDGPLYVVGESAPVRALELLPTGELLVADGRKLSSEEVSLRFTPAE